MTDKLPWRCDECDGPATTTYNGYPACVPCAYQAAVEDGVFDVMTDLPEDPMETER